MERVARFVHDDIPQARLDKLDMMLAQTSTSKEDAALFAEMLSLSNDGRYPALDLSPEQRRQRTLEALISQVQELTHQSPVLMIFEDAHWSDPTSLEVLGRIVDRVRSLPVLLFVTFRPEFDPPWLGRPYVTALDASLSLPPAYWVGSLAMFAAMRRASSVVNGFANDLPQEARPLALRLCWFE